MRDGKSSKDKNYSLRDWFKGGGWKQAGGKYDGKPCAKQPGQKTKPYCRDADDRAAMSKEEKEKRAKKKRKEDPNPDRKGKAINVKTEETILERGDHWHPDPEKDRKLGGPGANARAREDRAAASKPKSDPKKLRTGESYYDYNKRQKPKSTAAPKPKERKRDKIGRALGNLVDRAAGIKKEEFVSEKAGEKDACYKKVKASAKVWPSAYASGRLVQCRKKGADNYGKSTKKESYDYSDWRDDFKATEYEFIDLIKPEPLIQESYTIDTEEHRRQQRAAKIRNLAKKGSTEGERSAAERKTKGPKMFGEEEKKIGGGNLKKLATKAVRRVDADVDGDVDTDDMKSSETGEFIPSLDGKKKLKSKVRFEQSDWRNELEEGAAWTKKSGKNKEGGLNEKGRKSYERENPGSDLKAPSKKKGNKRRASFCARMKGMKKKLTSAKTARDPDSRINKSLRAWNC